MGAAGGMCGGGRTAGVGAACRSRPELHLVQRHGGPVTAARSQRPGHSGPVTAARSQRPGHSGPVTAARSQRPGHSGPVTAARSQRPGHSGPVTAARSQRPGHSGPVTAARSQRPGHSGPVTAARSQRPGPEAASAGDCAASRGEARFGGSWRGASWQGGVRGGRTTGVGAACRARPGLHLVQRLGDPVTATRPYPESASAGDCAASRGLAGCLRGSGATMRGGGTVGGGAPWRSSPRAAPDPTATRPGSR